LQQIKSDTEAHTLWKKSNRNLAIGISALAVELGCLFWFSAVDSDEQLVPLIGTIVSGGVSIGFSLSSSNLKKKAILKYNSNLDIGSLDFGPTQNGLGMVVSF